MSRIVLYLDRPLSAKRSKRPGRLL